MRCLWLVLLCWAPTLWASDLPDDAAVKAAVERGIAVRKHEGVASDALIKQAVILRLGGVRVGYVFQQVEDAKGEGGATYRLVTRYKFAAVLEGGVGSLTTGEARYTLSSDFALRTGAVNDVLKTRDKKGDLHDDARVTTSLKVDGDTLVVARETAEAGGPGEPQPEEKIALEGVKPVPSDALPALAVLALAKAEKGKAPEPLCVPAFDVLRDTGVASIDPAWLAFEKPTDKDPRNAAWRVVGHYLSGRIGKAGLLIEPPTKPTWESQLFLQLPVDEKGYALALQPPNLGPWKFALEPVEPAALDENAAIDWAAIAKAMQK